MLAASGPSPLRFPVGTRVLCRTAAGWEHGVVLAQGYREAHWPPGKTAPYQVELQDGSLIFAPFDEDRVIREARGNAAEEAEAGGGGVAELTEAEQSALLTQLTAQMPAEVRALPKEERIAWLQRTLRAIHRQLNGASDEEGEAAALDAEEAAATQRTHQLYRESVLARYPRRHPRLFDAGELDSFVVPALREAVKSGDARPLLTEAARGIFTFDLFTREYCDLLLEECEHFEEWCIQEEVELHRPNTMNNYGAILDDFGMEGTMDALMKRYVQPLARLVGYSDVAPGAVLSSHHAFLVSYALDKDLDLSFHVDQSDVTLNACLGREFEGGSLYFRGVRCPAHQNSRCAPEEAVTCLHRRGQAVLHRGHHRHGANAILAGERHNLILWCRAPTSADCSESATRKRRRGVEECPAWCWMHEPSAPAGQVGRRLP